jgi:hypothetical protein
VTAHIVALGLCEIGHTYAGPFDSLDDAAIWAAEVAKLNSATIHILRLNTPQEVAENLQQHRTEK